MIYTKARKRLDHDCSDYVVESGNPLSRQRSHDDHDGLFPLCFTALTGHFLIVGSALNYISEMENLKEKKELNRPESDAIFFGGLMKGCVTMVVNSSNISASVSTFQEDGVLKILRS